MTRPSLLHLFEAPGDSVGTFGWMCGFSASSLFMNEALERFSRRTFAQRAAAGEFSLALMLDPQELRLSPLDTPGVAHLPLRAMDAKRFRLLHAKVALLAFRHPQDESWILRLVVSTGNWTQQTVEDGLDLAWCTEVRSTELEGEGWDGPVDLAQRCADMCAAVGFLGWLRASFDERVLDAALGHPLAMQRQRWWKGWTDACARLAAGVRPRFFDNRNEGLLAQLPGLVTAHARAGRRNYLAMGSGFFQAPTPSAPVPSVLTDIVAALGAADLLTRQPKVEVYVNEDACQAVAGSMRGIAAKGWGVFAPGRPAAVFGEPCHRTLHAKFIFSAKDIYGACVSGWLYLGSGNLTGPGFIRKASIAAGNIEAGIVIEVQRMPWESDGLSTPAITHLLPVQRGGTPLTQNQPPQAGAPMPEREAAWLAPPLAWLQWRAEADGGQLSAPNGEEASIDVLLPDGSPCERRGDAWVWPAAMPRQVVIRWNGSATQPVPVVDEHGRVGATALPDLELQNIAAQLLAFPALEAADAQELEGQQERTDTMPARDGAPLPGEVSSGGAIRLMMTQIEWIAQKQVQVTPADWAAWCHRLEQTLCQARDSNELAQFKRLGLNPLRVLAEPAFLPAHAGAESAARERMVDALRRVEVAWGLDTWPCLGGKI